MSTRAIEFVENWVSENVKASGNQKAGDKATAIVLASRCFEAAEAEGIPQKEIEEVFEDLPAFIAGEIEEANEDAARVAAKDA